MPIFEYACGDCGHRMEFLEKTRGKHKHACEQCKGTNLEKLLSGFSVGRATPPICGSCPTGPAANGLCPSSGGCCGQA